MPRVYESDGYWGRLLANGISKLMVLRALFDGPGHGYALVHRIEIMSGGFCAPTRGGVYPVLREFERAGCVRHRIDAHGRRLSKVYELTTKGRKALAAGLAAWERGLPCMRKAIDMR